MGMCESGDPLIARFGAFAFGTGRAPCEVAF